MKILCLHPWGTSGQIFERQMASLSGQLGATHEWVYINAPYTSAPARELPDFVTGPYYCWYEGLSSVQLRESHKVVAETIEDEGPFDGVVGFSQGASVALSFLLHHEMTEFDKPPPFRFGLFFCSNVVISPDPKFKADAFAKYSRYYKKPGDEPGRLDGTNGNGAEDDGNGEAQTESKKEQNGTSHTNKPAKHKPAPKHRAMLILPSKREALVDEIVGLIQQLSSHTPGHTNPGTHSWPAEKEGQTIDDFPRIMHPLTLKERIAIPTVHVISKGDPISYQGELAVRLCEKRKAKVVHISGQHRLPTSMMDLRAVTSAVEWAIQKSQQM